MCLGGFLESAQHAVELDHGPVNLGVQDGAAQLGPESHHQMKKIYVRFSVFLVYYQYR